MRRLLFISGLMFLLASLSFGQQITSAKTTYGGYCCNSSKSGVVHDYDNNVSYESSRAYTPFVVAGDTLPSGLYYIWKYDSIGNIIAVDSFASQVNQPYGSLGPQILIMRSDGLFYMLFSYIGSVTLIGGQTLHAAPNGNGVAILLFDGDLNLLRVDNMQFNENGGGRRNVLEVDQYDNIHWITTHGKLFYNGQLISDTLNGYSWLKINSSGVVDTFVPQIIKGPNGVNGLSQLHVDQDGSIYIAGQTKAPSFTVLDTVFEVPSSITSINNFGAQVYFIKIDKKANLLWMRHEGIPGVNMIPKEITRDAMGNVYLHITYHDQGLSSLLRAPPILAGDTLDFFYSHLASDLSRFYACAKYDKDGHPIWTQHTKGDGRMRTLSIIADDIGNIYLWGDFAKTFHFGDTTTVASGWRKGDMFLAKIDTGGQWVWAKGLYNTDAYVIDPWFGDPSWISDYPGSINYTKNGSIIATAWVILPTTFDTFYIPVDSLISFGSVYGNGNVFFVFDGAEPGIDKLENTISGRAFADLNNNNTQDVNEPGLKNVVVETSPPGTYTITDSIGDYEFVVDRGIYITTINNGSPFDTVVPSEHLDTFATLGLSDTINDFALQGAPLDASVRIFSGYASANQLHQLTAEVTNHGSSSANGVVTIKFDGASQFVNAIPTPQGVNGNEVTWNYNIQAPFGSAVFKVETLVQGSQGDTLLSTAELNPQILDTEVANNFDTTVNIVSSLFEGNDKQVSHTNLTSAQLSDRQELEYVIRFQNTGNNTANRVEIVDALDTKLDVSTFRMIGASHPYDLKLTGSRFLTWTFDPITLPGSGLDYTGSQGYVSFAIRPKASLTIGDTIRNDATVYIDVNPAKTTNLVMTTTTPQLTMGALQNTSFCAGESFTVDYTVTDTFLADNTFLLQLSNDPDDFNQAIIVASQQTNISGQLLAQLPDSLLSDTFALRIVATSPYQVSAEQFIITIGQIDSLLQYETICDSLTYKGQVYKNSGLYTHRYINNYGCDSIEQLNLTILPSSVNQMVVTSCDAYNLNGQLYTSSGLYIQRFTNQLGCDSVVMLDLTLGNTSGRFLNVSTCDSFELDNVVYQQSGSFQQTLTSHLGCDSIIYLNLDLGSSSSGVLTQSSCDSITVNNVTYTGSGTYQQILTNWLGCDSILSLNLEVLPSSSYSLSTTACDSFELNNSIYTSSGIYKQTFTNQSGCDSIITLDLEVYPSTASTYFNQTACDSFIYHGQVYQSSGFYQQQLLSNEGCDSLVTFDLSIPEINTTIRSINVGATILLESQEWQADTYQWIDCNTQLPIAGETSNTYTPQISGDYAVVVGKQGCEEQSGCETVSITITGIEELRSSEVNIYPNPNTGQFIVSTDQNTLLLGLSIYNNIGQEVLRITEENLVAGSNEINLGNQPTGIYFVEVLTEEGMSVNKLIVNR